MKSSNFKLLSILLISCLGIIVYSNTFHSSFHFDDETSIEDNFAIRHLSNLYGIWNFLPRRFVLYLSLALNYHFNRLDVFGYHLFNLAVHLISAILVWWFVRLTLSTPIMKTEAISKDANLIALFAGLVFVSHPVQTQAVTYIVQRDASLATLFYVASLCFYVKSRLLNDKPYYVCSLTTTVVAMFTKETAITLPLMILLYEYCFFKTKEDFNWKRTVPFLYTLLIIPVTILLTETSPERLRELQGEPGISPIHYLLTEFRVLVTYIRLLFLPFNQNADYDYPILQNFLKLPILISFLFLTSILFWAKHLLLKYRLAAFSIFWFFLTLLPESSILPIRDVIFEHRLYLPMVGFSIFLASGAYYLFAKKSINVMISILAILLVIYSILAYQRNKVWENEFTLWNDIVQKSPHKARGYGNRGYEYRKEGMLLQAMSDLNRALEINPEYPEAYNNRGIVYAKLGDPKRAIADFDKSIELCPWYKMPYNNRGIIYSGQGRINQALTNFNKAIALDPHYEDALRARGVIYYHKGNFAQAIPDFINVIDEDPGHSADYINLGLAYGKQGNYKDAIYNFNRAIAIDPDYAEGYFNRGSIYVREDKVSEAMADCEKAIELNPNYVEAYTNRGYLYAQEHDFDKAISDFTKAIEILPRHAEAYNNRGFIYFNKGNLKQALADYNKAIQINPHYGQSIVNRAVVYYQLKDYVKAWADVKNAEGLGVTVNPNFIIALKSVGKH